MSLVLDASIALAWCFDDEQTPEVLGLLDRVTEFGAHAPSLWALEVTNGLLMAERRKRVVGAVRAEMAVFLQALPIALDLHTSDHAWHTTTQLAARHGLTAHDSAYLELAQRRRLPLASLDRKLRAAAGVLGIDCLGVAA